MMTEFSFLGSLHPIKTDQNWTLMSHSIHFPNNITQSKQNTNPQISISHSAKCLHKITYNFVGRHTNWPILLTAHESAGTVNIISCFHPVSLLVWIFHDIVGWQNRSARSFSLSLGLFCWSYWLSITAGEPNDTPVIRNTNNTLSLWDSQTILWK